MKRFGKIAFVLSIGILFFNTSTFASTINGVIRESSASSVVTNNGDGTYTYNYTVTNLSPAPQVVNDINVWPTIVDYEIPINNPSDVRNISSPVGWEYEFLNTEEYQSKYNQSNPFNSQYVLHWYTHPEQEVPDALGFVVINPYYHVPIVSTGYNAFYGTSYYENSTDGFMFTSNLSPIDGPYSSSWEDSSRLIGDPPLPGGSGVVGGTLPYDPVPEPATMVLMSMGLTALTLKKRGKGKK